MNGPGVCVDGALGCRWLTYRKYLGLVQDQGSSLAEGELKSGWEDGEKEEKKIRRNEARLRGR
jgi:hypothetical protein